MGLLNLRNALMAGKRLPYDAEVEYLEFSNGSYINTGIIPTGIFTISVTASFTANAPSQSTIFSANSDAFVLRKNSQDIQFNGNGWWWAISTLNDTNAHIYRIESTDGTQLRYSVDEGSAVVGPQSLGDLSNLSHLLLGWRYVYTSQYGGLRLYHISYGTDHDFIPVRKGTVGYLYDRVSGKLFGNAGTGDFVLGPDVVPVEYLQSTGTQWIDTGTPTADKYIFECLFTDATADIKLFGNSYAYGRYRDLAIYQSRYRGTSIATSSNAWDRIEIDVAQPRLTVTRSGSTVGSATSWWSAYTGATPDTQYGTALPFGGHTNAYGSWYGTNRVACFYAAQGVRLRTRLFESWLGSELIEKLLPVRVGTEGAMMDVLTRRIYRNAGTGAFGYGNDLKYPIPA